ncbi:glideosome-associated protein 45, putative [Plasmodium ovale]|uniref:Glideosome-associated protein 45, putative n=2 Tax=Plasmodium ovale TaxID=36330 RepID=A0A1A8W6B5_PLAOA|nr:glideosome-associated protein 45, putative [Plasmodium ovale curtisi]SBS98340.1 glideosome-associated protein 45, putative [Plasmodium ovale curtisi]SCQ17039.1 glideosome-associated protein 45, putative [Plasmodium ovale]
MGSACRKNKAKEPKRKDIDELAEREKLENEPQDIEQVPQDIEEQLEEQPEEPPEHEEELDDIKDDEELDYNMHDNKSFDEKQLDDLERSNSDIYSESHKYDNASDKLETGSQLTLSTDATGIVQQVTKLSEPAHEESLYNSYKSVTPCDMNKLDETAKVFSRRCGCDLGDRHDENACKICRKIDLSDTPLLT